MSSAIGKALLLRITYVKCGLHTNPKVRKNLQTLGLKKLHQTVIQKNVRPIRGMINSVKQHVYIEPIIYRGPKKNASYTY